MNLHFKGTRSLDFGELDWDCGPEEWPSGYFAKPHNQTS